MDESLLQEYPGLEETHFWWLSRRELIRQLIDEWIVPPNSKSILDVGCGSGLLARELASASNRVSGVDVAAYPQWAQPGPVEFRAGDYLDLAPQLGSHDVVLALDVMEHVEEEAAFVSSIRENLRPGGRAVVTVPAYRWLWSGHDEINHHFRRYTAHRLREALSVGGVRVERCGYLFFGLIGPKLAALVWERLAGRDGVGSPPDTLNQIALSYFRFEHGLAARRRNFLPAGTSVIAVCRREA